jgi:hypothetical protein
MSGVFEGAIFNDKDETTIKHHLPTNHCNAQPYDKEMLDPLQSPSTKP